MLSNISIKDFMDDLASDLPAPGGGGAAAICAALSSALCSMVFNLTVDKKIFHGYDENTKEMIREGIKKVNIYKDEFLKCVDKDAEAFKGLMASFKFPKNTEAEIEKRKNMIQNGYKKALEVPFKMAQMGMELYNFIMNASMYGNKNVLSDAVVAVIMLNAAIESSIVNVKINLTGIKDKVYVENINKSCGEILQSIEEKKKNILKVANERMGM